MFLLVLKNPGIYIYFGFKYLSLIRTVSGNQAYRVVPSYTLQCIGMHVSK